jgi:hypothetical protein
VENLGNSIHRVFEGLITFASNGDICYADDTQTKILDLKKNLDLKKSKRKEDFTNGVVSKVKDRKISLFFTGNHHAGENMEILFSQRRLEHQIIYMSDALSWNLPKKYGVIWAKCLVHCCRGSWDLRDSHSKMVKSVLHLFSKIFLNEKKNY